VPTIDEQYDEDADYSYEDADDSGVPNFNIIIGAPDLTTLIKRPLNRTGREYRDRAASGLRAVMVGSIQTGNFSDAAAILWHGPGAATAIGALCADSPKAAKIVDYITTPSNPLSACILALLPLLGQIGRNHEDELRELPSKWRMGKTARAARKAEKSEQKKQPPRFTIKIWRWKIPVRMQLKFPSAFISGIRSQTHHPGSLAMRVFTDPDVVKSLEAMGIIIQKDSVNGQEPV